MITCKACKEEFKDEDEANQHVIDEHADVCDEKLQEYVDDSRRDAQEELLEYDEPEDK
jgi:hypothetical protein